MENNVNCPVNENLRNIFKSYSPNVRVFPEPENNIIVNNLISSINEIDPLCTFDTAPDYFPFVKKENDFFNENYFYCPDENTKIFLFRMKWIIKEYGDRVDGFYSIEKE